MSASWELRQGDALTRLREMPAASVHCCITSPPYYGLRDYGTGEWSGGDPACDHVKGEMRRGVNLAQSAASTRGGAKKIAEVADIPYGRVCAKCGATRTDEQLGLEETPDEYIVALVEVFAEVRRVLRADGTLWLNIGDTYNNRAKTRESSHQPALNGFEDDAWQDRAARGGVRMSITAGGLKEKDLFGIPWMLAFALRADGWYLRSDIIWSKPNPMPESVTDRPTSSHEHVFLLAKSRSYYYDAEAIREPDRGTDHPRTVHHEASLEPSGALKSPHSGIRTASGRNGAGRNRRNVWEIATIPYPDAHYATFPPKLVEPMILAGAAPKVCGECGAPWERETEREDQGHDGSRYGERAVGATGGAISGGTARSTLGSSNGRLTGKQRTTGWRPTCNHNSDTGRAVVLDPFAGTGTTLQVAVEHGRSAIGLELNPESIDLARRRLVGVTPPLFAGDGT